MEFKDFQGQQLNIGDFVAYASTRGLRIAKIVERRTIERDGVPEPIVKIKLRMVYKNYNGTVRLGYNPVYFKNPQKFIRLTDVPDEFKKAFS